MDPRAAMADVHRLYAALPAMACAGCGACCISPHITFPEFAILLEHIATHWSTADQAALVREPPEPSRRYEGNLRCPLQAPDGSCTVYDLRPLICRLEGHVVMETLGLRQTPICGQYARRTDPPVSAEAVDRWIEAACTLAVQCGTPAGEPYWLTALNIQCWFAVAVDPDLERPPFIPLRRGLRRLAWLESFAAAYRDHTGFAATVDDVEAFFALVNARGEPTEALALLARIQARSPTIGSYYQSEAAQYAALMHELAAEQATVNDTDWQNTGQRKREGGHRPASGDT